MGGAVRLDIGCIDRCRGLDPAGLDKGLQNALPDAASIAGLAGAIHLEFDGKSLMSVLS